MESFSGGHPNKKNKNCSVNMHLQKKKIITTTEPTKYAKGSQAQLLDKREGEAWFRVLGRKTNFLVQNFILGGCEDQGPRRFFSRYGASEDVPPCVWVKWSGMSYSVCSEQHSLMLFLELCAFACDPKAKRPFVHISPTSQLPEICSTLLCKG